MHRLIDRDLTDPRWIRGGVIIYSMDRQFGFAIDRHYRTLIDFGGHREPSDGDILDTICRETEEESLGELILDPELLEKCPSFSFENYLEVVVPIPLTSSELTSRLRRVFSESDPTTLESNDIVWLTPRELFSIQYLPENRVHDTIYPKCWNPISWMDPVAQNTLLNWLESIRPFTED